MKQPLAYIHPEAKIAKNVVIEPFVTIDKNVEIEEGTWVGPNVSIMEGARIGKNCKIFPGTVIAAEPQDLKFEGEESLAIIGDNTTIRENVTVNRGTKASGKTIVGNNCLLMANAHIAHDCLIEDEVIISNSVQLAGHVTVEKGAVIGGLSGIHQFVRIGKYTMIGGASAVERDIPHFCLAKGNRAYLEGINIIGLKRRNFNKETIKALLNAYEIIFGNKKDKKKTINESLSIVLEKYGHILEVKEFVEFIKNSKRGCTLPKKYNDKNNDRKGKKRRYKI